MGYAEKLQKLCVLRGLDQATLAEKVGLSKSTMSRILSGVQEPKLRLAYDLARALGVTLDELLDEGKEIESFSSMMRVSDEERLVLKIVRRLGVSEAIDRLLGVPSARAGEAARPGGEGP